MDLGGLWAEGCATDDSSTNPNPIPPIPPPALALRGSAEMTEARSLLPACSGTSGLTSRVLFAVEKSEDSTGGTQRPACFSGRTMLMCAGFDWEGGTWMRAGGRACTLDVSVLCSRAKPELVWIALPRGRGEAFPPRSDAARPGRGAF